MKIAFLNRYQNQINRGAETFVRELATKLSAYHTVDILADKDADNLGKILAGKYDVIVAMNGRSQSMKASLGRLLGGYKLVITGQSGIGKDDLGNILIAKPDVFVSLTESMSKWAKKWAWGTKIVKIHNGVDLDVFNPQGAKFEVNLKKPIVLSVGALVWYKHHERTIEALAHVPEVSLLIVGKGEDEAKLRDLAQKKLGDRFQIMNAPYQDLPKIYRVGDLFVLPSWEREAFGIVYIEALACGLPVVAPDDSPRQEIIGNSGILVDVTDPLKYAQAIKKALDVKWGAIPRKQAEKFSWDKIAQEYNQLFKSLKK